MADKVARYLLWSQVNFFVFLGVCVALMPRFLFSRNEGGVSNYGLHRATVVPYSLAFLLSGLFMLLAARSVPGIGRFRYALYTLSGLLLLVLVTTYPYKTDAVFGHLHMLAAILTFCFEMALAAWLALAPSKNKLNAAWLAAEAAGFLMAFLTLTGDLHLLFVSQIITSLAFGVLLVRNARAFMVN